MDFLLLGVLIFYFVKGWLKGFLQILFSLLFSIGAIFLAYKLCATFGSYLQNLNLFNFENSIKTLLNGYIPGEFSNIDDFIGVVGNSNFVFKFFLLKLLSNVSFEGNLTAGDILAPILNSIIFKIIAFIIIFIALSILFGFLKILIDKVIKFLKLKEKNRFLGGLFGIVKGFLIFSIFYILLFNFANLILNETLLNFCTSGSVTNFLYKNFIEKFSPVFLSVFKIIL